MGIAGAWVHAGVGVHAGYGVHAGVWVHGHGHGHSRSRSFARTRVVRQGIKTQVRRACRRIANSSIPMRNYRCAKA